MTPDAQDSGKTVAALEYLRAHGLGVALLIELHPTRNRESFGAAISYRKARASGTYQEMTTTYHHRLLFVAAEHQRGGGAFDSLVAAAIAKFPWPP